MKFNLNIFSILYIFSIGLLLASFILLLVDIKIAITFLELSIIVIFFSSLFIFTKLTNNIINIYNIFLAVFGFFLLSRLFLHFLGYNYYNQTFFFTSYTFEQKYIFRTLINLQIALISFTISSFYFIKLFPVNYNKTYYSDTLLYKISLLVLILLTPVLFKYIYDTLLFISTNGYIALHKGLRINHHTFYKIIIIVTIVFYIIFVSSKPHNSLYYWFFTLLIVVALVADGRRGMGTSMLLVSFWYYLNYKNIKLKLYSLLIGIFIVFFTLMIVGTLRFKGKTLETYNIFDFIYKQGFSIQVVTYSIKYDSQIIYNYFDLVFGGLHKFFDNVIKKVLLMNPNISLENRALKYKIYSSYISIIVNKELFDKGFGIGGSYIAQLFSVGKEFAQIIGGVFLGFIFSIFNRTVNSQSRIKQGIILIILPSVIYIPRDNMFDFLVDSFLLIFFFIIIHYIIQTIQKKKYDF